MERVVAGLQQRRVVSEKEKRILAYHEAGHALMSYLMGDALPVHKVTIVSRGQALGYTLNLPTEDRYLHTKEELVDMMKVFLAGRAAEQVVFGRVTNGAANDLEKATGLARSMVFEYGMGEIVSSRTMRADNYALSEETKRLRDAEQARLTDEAYQEAIRLITKHRAHLDRLAAALLEKETLNKDELDEMLADIEPESRAAETIGTVRALPVGAGYASPSCRASTTSVSQSKTSTRRSRATSACSAPSSKAVRPTASRASRRRRCASGRAASSCSRPLGPDTPVGRFLARRGPGMHHVAYEVDDLPAELTRLEGQGAELIDAAPTPGPLRDAGRLRPPRRRPRRPLGAGRACLSACASRSASTAARSWARSSTSPRPTASSRRWPAARTARSHSTSRTGATRSRCPGSCT